jgi:hypothetical protein
VDPAARGVSGRRPDRQIGGIERQRRRAAERRAHQHDRLEHVRPDQCAAGRDRRAEVVPYDRCHRSVAERRYQRQGIPHDIEETERADVAVVVTIPARGLAVAPLVGRDHMVSRGRQRQHNFAPAVGELREAMEEQDTGAVLSLEAGFEHAHRETVDVFHEPGADFWRATDFGHSQGSIICRPSLSEGVGAACGHACPFSNDCKSPTSSYSITGVSS